MAVTQLVLHAVVDERRNGVVGGQVTFEAIAGEGEGVDGLLLFAWVWE